MDSLLALLSIYLAPFVQGLDVVPFAGDCRKYIVTHSIGAILLKFKDGVLTVELPFRGSAVRCAADYLEMVRVALSKGVITEDGSKIELTFLKNHFLFYDIKTNTDYHAATFKLIQSPKADTPALSEKE